MRWPESQAHAIWASQLRDMAAEKRAAGLQAEAGALEAEAERHEIGAEDARVREATAEADVAAELAPGPAWRLIHDIQVGEPELELEH